MQIKCNRDKVIHTQLVKPGRGVDEDETPRGKRLRKRGGMAQRVIMAVDLYYIVRREMGKNGYMRLMQKHFKHEIEKWNEGVLEYIETPLSSCDLGESYYNNDIVRRVQKSSQAFAFEISDMSEDYKAFRYHGYYTVGAWRDRYGKPIIAPNLPRDWNKNELTKIAKLITQ